MGLLLVSVKWDDDKDMQTNSLNLQPSLSMQNVLHLGQFYSFFQLASESREMERKMKTHINMVTSLLQG